MSAVLTAPPVGNAQEVVIVSDEGQQQQWIPMSTHIKTAAARNLRDLGGTPVRGGGEIAPGKLFRAEALAHPGTASRTQTILTEDDVATYRDLGIKTVVDLRSAREQNQSPSAWIAPSDARLESIPFNDGVEGDTNFLHQIQEGTLQDFSADDLAAYYVTVLGRRGPEFGAAVEVCATSDHLPVLVHCASGKDRTGLLIALLLELLGVERDHVVAEYALTESVWPDRIRSFDSVFGGYDVDLSRVMPLFLSPPEAMRKALERIDAQYGSVTQYMTDACGVSAATIENLRAAMITSPD
jgi:protein-tyrosine phosphatase